LKPHPTTPPPLSEEQERRDRAAPSSEEAPRTKENALLRAIHKLALTDILQLANDPLLYRVVALEKLLSGRFKVSLRSLDEATGVMLVRSGSDHVSVLSRAKLLP